MADKFKYIGAAAVINRSLSKSKVDISLRSLYVLWYISASGGCTLSYLLRVCKYLGKSLSANQLQGTINDLQAKGYVSRSLRSVYAGRITITIAGNNLLAACDKLCSKQRLTA